MKKNKNEILKLLHDVFDPEIPVLNIVEMGIVRDVIFEEDELLIKITPTYMGCPAMNAIENDILDILFSNGLENVKVKTVYSPAWTTNWMSEETKNKLKKYGIAPPRESSELLDKIECPFCNSDETILTSEFGSTACKSLHYCDHCHQPFEHFKCI
ncbi:MAG: phenylacetate-CoA oxygenase subunit PaaJ [Ignavibacteriae bacterium]|nr:phenylacetate-CoA oxygenase subunit PaaJ [Ignavibacteriota bacterium]NOH00154.1 phenylacetate-CoA oxygenase subunit PaaJ [Ignavibacteriota bacterium]